MSIGAVRMGNRSRCSSARGPSRASVARWFRPPHCRSSRRDVVVGAPWSTAMFPGLLPSALYSILCWATAGSTWASPSSRQPDHGRVLTRCVREDDDAVRREHASRKRCGALRRRAAVAERPLVALNRGYHGPLSRVRSPPRSRWPERRRGVRCRRFVSSRWWRPRGRGLPSASGAVRSVIAAAPPSTTSGLGAGRQPPSAPAHG